MSENNSQRKPANEVLLKFLKENKISFFIRKQRVRYLEDNGIFIEAPTVIAYYEDEVKKSQQEPGFDLNPTAALPKKTN